MTNEEQKEVAAAQTRLDQLWAAIELLAPWISKIANDGITPECSQNELDIAKACCQLIGEEIATRVSQREQYLICQFAGELPSGDIILLVKAYPNSIYIYVNPSRVQKSDGSPFDFTSQDTRYRVSAYRQLSNMHAVIINDKAILVPNSEIIYE